MDKYQKKVLIIVGVIIGIISILAIILSFYVKKEKKPNIEQPTNNNKVVIKKDIKKLNDVDIFFTLQKVINEYYEILTGNIPKNLINILDENYVKDNNINENNIYNIINSNYDLTEFTATNIYYNPGSTIIYYFINGNLINSDIISDNATYYNSINYLIIVDERTNCYAIRPLANNINIQEYAKNYNIIEREINSNYKLNKSNIKEDNKLTLYISNFKRLLIHDPEEAFNTLSDAAKGKYNNYNDFYNSRAEIYEKLSTKIFSFSKKENGKQNIYSIIDDNQNEITIFENSIMDYKIYF